MGERQRQIGMLCRESRYLLSRLWRGKNKGKGIRGKSKERQRDRKRNEGEEERKGEATSLGKRQKEMVRLEWVGLVS